MKYNRYLLTLGIFSFLLLSAGCRDKSRKEAIAAERENWENAIKDSLSVFEKRLEETEKALPVKREEVSRLLGEFTFIDNPREVEGFYIYTPLAKEYPLTGSGIAARLSKGEGAEVIAALSGANFEAIRLSAPDGESVASESVPYDQALNYRAGGLNTVAFTGHQADSLLLFAADHSGEPLTLTYLNPAVVKSVKISPSQQTALETTGRLVRERKAMLQMEGEIPMLSRKIQHIKGRISEEENETKQ